MEIILDILKIGLSIFETVQKANRPQPPAAASQNPLAAMLAQQQANDAATCELLQTWMAQSQAQEAALMQQLMGMSQTFWW